MTVVALLVVVALVQSAFLLGIVVLLLVNRARASRRRRVRASVTAELTAPLQRWLAESGTPDDVAAILVRLPVQEALAQAILISTSRAAPTQRDDFRSAIRDAAWVAEVLGRARSRSWWRRLDAARLLAIVGTARDAPLLHRLLDDEHPAVQSVAAQCLASVGDLDAVSAVLERLPDRALAVQLSQFAVLRETWWLTTPALLERMVAEARPASLETWIRLAAVIGTPDVLARVCELQAHAEPRVRTAVARALTRYYHPDSESVLLAYLADADWEVRSSAARSLGALGSVAAIPHLAVSLGDENWWVRFRSALALAQMGEAGRATLRAIRAGGDRYAAEMATMIGGLSSGSVVELAES